MSAAHDDNATKDAVDRVAVLARILLAQQQNVARIEAELATAKADARRTAEVDLPELMLECGLELAKLSDGTKVEIRDEVDCAITEANRPRAHAWLEANGFGGLIKTSVIVAFPREERSEAVALADFLFTNKQLQAEVEESVHPSTLKSFVKERMAAGAAPPADLFSLRPYSKAKLTLPRAVAPRP